LQLYSQKSKLLAGPTIGHVSESEAKIWIAYQGLGNHKIYLKDTLQNLLNEPDSITHLSIEGKVSATAHFSKLSEGTFYQIIIYIENWGWSSENYIQTKRKTDELQEFNYVFGSCNLIAPFPWKAFWPGFKIRILKNIRQENSDFMIWLGDNVYYLGKDYASQKNMFNRQLKYRQNHTKLDKLLANQPNYSIWDDHDYGPNDSNSSFELREESYEVYKSFWPNPSYGVENLPGVFFTFNYEDAQFFMTDNRFYQTDYNAENATLLGKEQLQWLKDELLKSLATFKIISIGSQVISNINTHESYSNFLDEKMDLLSFIDVNNINGVIFLSGDRHISDVNVIKRSGKYSLYDFTSSPMLSPGSMIVGAIDKNNPDRLEGALVKKRNYAKMYFLGKEGNRSINVKYYNVNGKEIRSYTLHESELKN
jgi:alkaline phosphatase D